MRTPLPAATVEKLESAGVRVPEELRTEEHDPLDSIYLDPQFRAAYVQARKRGKLVRVTGGQVVGIS